MCVDYYLNYGRDYNDDFVVIVVTAVADVNSVNVVATGRLDIVADVHIVLKVCGNDK